MNYIVKTKLVHRDEVEEEVNRNAQFNYFLHETSYAGGGKILLVFRRDASNDE